MPGSTARATSVAYVLVDPADGDPFFIGTVRSRASPSRIGLGSVTPTPARDHESLARRGAPQQVSTLPGRLRCSTPDVTDPKVPASLRLAAVRFVVPESWRGTAYALGTAIPAGLNDAVALNGAFSEDDGALPELTTYLPADGGRGLAQDPGRASAGRAAGQHSGDSVGPGHRRRRSDNHGQDGSRLPRTRPRRLTSPLPRR